MRLVISGSEFVVIGDTGTSLNFPASFGHTACSGAAIEDAGARILLQLAGALGLTEIRVELDTSLGAIWCFYRHRKRPNFTLPLLKEIRAVQRLVTDYHRDYPREAERLARFVIWASDLNAIYCLGGDLTYFVDLVEQGNVTGLKAYAMSCIDCCFANYSGLHADVIVGALVTGDALGGGFEAALSCDFIIAENTARFGLPEILYGLFPGMGAYSFLSRKIGHSKAEAIILDGRRHKAPEIKDLGLVECVAAPSQGRAVMERHLAKLSKRFDAVLSVHNAKRKTSAISYREMADITSDWVDAASRLSGKNLQRMRRLAASQEAWRGLGKEALA